MVDTAVARISHLLFAALWAGSVFYVAFVVLPLARDGAFTTTAPLETISGKLTTISRVSSLVLLVTGGHLAGTGYTVESLVGTPNGQLVLVMVVLWLAMTGLIEVGAKRLESGLDGKKLREPATETLPLFRAAAVAGVLLMVVSGLITTNFVANML